MGYDLSATGVAFQTRSRYTLGERVVVMFRVSADAMSSATGRVVRAIIGTDRTSLFPHFIAVQFDVPLWDLA